MTHPQTSRTPLRFAAASAAALALMLAACTTPAPAPAPPTPPPRISVPPPPPPVMPVEAEPQAPATQLMPPLPGPIGAMLAYADRVRGLPGGELNAEIARLGEPNDPATQMQLGLALAQTRNPPDLARAAGLMQRVAGNASPEGLSLAPLARLLAARYLEQRRVEDDRDRQVQQLKDAQRRIDQLNDRIEALRAIERSFARPPAPPPPPVNGGPRP
ncbi:hypothetical protein [Xenophilus azovorans]|jgi:hypothetical protein|uniref:hypothetical protein n=2 Tax=Xenophilus TaxID=151754 RepID=UPI0005702C40|nr:hypothetical protein [Xenophilus azovorans]